MATKTKKKTTKKTAAKKRKKPVAPYTAKFSPKPVTDRERKVLSFMSKSNGPVGIKETGDVIFKRERPQAKRMSWVRNCLRNLRAHRYVVHFAKTKTMPARYEASTSGREFLRDVGTPPTATQK